MTSEAIAQAIRECVGKAPNPNAWTKGYDAGVVDVAWRMAEALEGASPGSFVRSDFLEACGVADMVTISTRADL